MFLITEDPSSGSLVQCLAKNYKNGSIVSVDMDKVGVMATYSDPIRLSSLLELECVYTCLTQLCQTSIHTLQPNILTRCACV